MRQVQALEIEPGQTLELKPGGMHMMFMGLKQPLQEGQKLKGTLVFEKAGTVAVEFAIRGIGASGPAGDHHHH
jgi:copper(I)-binding protein